MGNLSICPLGMGAFLFSVSIWKRFVSRASIVVLCDLKVVQSISYFFGSTGVGTRACTNPKANTLPMQKFHFELPKPPIDFLSRYRSVP